MLGYQCLRELGVDGNSGSKTGLLHRRVSGTVEGKSE